MKIRIIILLLFANILDSLSQNASFITSKDQDCNILKANFDASGSTGAPPLTYYWDFGNGNTTSGPDKAVVDAVYVQPGDPVVKLYVIDANGSKSAPVSKTLHILSGPKIDFSPSDASTCPGTAVQFHNATQAGSSPITGYIWNIGSNISIRSKEASYTFGSTGEYDVTLIVTDSNGCNMSLKKEKLVSVQNNFASSFYADSTYRCTAPFQTSFHDATDYSKTQGHSFSYHWDFGDGSTSGDQHPTKTYTNPGSYDVSLLVSDQTAGCTSFHSQSQYISIGALRPHTQIILSSSQCNRYTYALNPNSNVLPSRFVKTVDLGDGQTYTLTSEDYFYHTYTKAGTYIVRTRYADPTDKSCIQVGFDTLIVPPSEQDVVADQVSGCLTPMTVHFSASHIPDGLFYQWDFGDGTFSQEAAPQKIYTTKGNYTVKLNVSTTSGCNYAIEKSQFIQVGTLSAYFLSDAQKVQELPKEFNLHPIKDTSVLQGGCIPLTVHFTNQSVGNGLSYQWNFGDGTTSTTSSAQVTHMYLTEGIYSPTLTVSEADGCTDTYTCAACVRAGSPPKTTISATGPDTVCCLYDKTFTTDVDLNKVDFLWYDIALNDGSSTGLTQAYYKNAHGDWTLEDNTGTTQSYTPIGTGLHFIQSNFATPTGNQPDLYFYAYKNGCPTKIELPDFQKHLLPWGTFSPISCEIEQNLKGGDTLDFNKIGGDWLIGKDANGQWMKLSKATVTFEYKSTNGCSMPVYTQSYTPASLGFDITQGSFEKIRQAGMFPKIVLPACAGYGDQVLSTTYLYTSDDAQTYYNQGKCLCQEHWPYKIGRPILPVYSLNVQKGCAPLRVDFKAGSSDFNWTFENGMVLTGTAVTHTFSSPGTYRFRNISHGCSSTYWTDSIVVYGLPTVHLKANQTVFCLNDNTVNTTNKTIELTDTSIHVAPIQKWDWDFSSGHLLSTSDNKKVSFAFSEKDVPIDPKNGVYVGLTVTDQHGCQAKDSLRIILRKTTPAFSLSRSTGCYDTLKITPNFQQAGSFPSYSGKVTANLKNQGSTYKVYEQSLSDLANHPILLDYNGTYDVQMRVQNDALGVCPNEKDTTLYVHYQSLSPDMQILGPTTFSCVPAMVQVKDISTPYHSNPVTAWDWTLVNTKTNVQLKGTGVSPSPFALTDSGYYNVGLTVQDQKGCKKTIWKDSVIYINALQGHIDSLPPPLCPGKMAFFKGSSSNKNTVYWDFGDGFIGTGREAYHAYKSSGERKISFIVTDSSQCRKSFIGKVMVKEAPNFTLGHDTLLCEGNTLILQGPSHANYSYAWNTGAVTSSLAVTKAGFYALQVRDTTLNCPNADSIHVMISIPPHVYILPIPPICLGETIHLKAQTDKEATNPIWKNNGATIGRDTALIWVVNDTLPIYLQVENQDHCKNLAHISLPILQRPTLQLSDQFVCPGDSALLLPSATPKHPLFHYQWYQHNVLIAHDTFPSKEVYEPGNYEVTYGKSNCMASAKAEFGFHPLPPTTTNERKVIFCEEYGSIQIDGGIASTYEWFQEKESTRYLSIDKIGNYILKIGNEFHCYAFDTVIVENRCAPKLYVPNAFTPEQEGENKVHTLFGYNIGSFELLIFNRWGEVIYESKDFHQPWDGYYRNELMPSGSYPWIIKYSGNNPDNTSVHQLEGKVVLVR